MQKKILPSNMSKEMASKVTLVHHGSVHLFEICTQDACSQLFVEHRINQETSEQIDFSITRKISNEIRNQEIGVTLEIINE